MTFQFGSQIKKFGKSGFDQSEFELFCFFLTETKKGKLFVLFNIKQSIGRETSILGTLREGKETRTSVTKLPEEERLAAAATSSFIQLLRSESTHP